MGGRPLLVFAGLGLGLVALGGSGADPKPPAWPDYAAHVLPTLKKYCLDCHSAKAKKGGLDLERFATAEQVRKDLTPWTSVLEQIETGEMPPRGKPRPTDGEKQRLLAWTRGFLDAEARARAGDPGHVPLRRLSNAEYDATIRALTGVDLRPTREFPADGAAGEGFTNAAEALTDISPTLLNKYLLAAKGLADHAVLLPDGFRFSPSKARRDWTDESTARLRQFYARFTDPEGRLPVAPYLGATVRHREALLAGKVTTAEVAAREKLNAKYLGILWQALTDATPSHPLDAVRARWRTATEKDVAALAGEVAVWQKALWTTHRVGSYQRPEGAGYAENLSRQFPADPVGSPVLRLAAKPIPGQSEVVLRLMARELFPTAEKGIVWHRPRFEGPGKPTLLLRDYASFGPAFEADLPSLFRDAAKYLAASAHAANTGRSLDDLARERGLDAAYLKRWAAWLALPAPEKGPPKTSAAAPLLPLAEKLARNPGRPAITGWRKKGAELPALLANSSNQAESIPGRVPAHGVVVHPTPAEFVAVAWKSPVAGQVRVEARVVHAHPACGNGVAWWLEHRRAGRATPLGEGKLDLGQGAVIPQVPGPPRTITLEKDDQVVLAVDARDGDHVCDLTEVGLTLTEQARPGRVWDLAKDLTADVQAGNPHADRFGHADVWAFVFGASRGGKGGPSAPSIPAGSVLADWRAAVVDPARQEEATKLAARAAALLSGPRPTKGPDQALHDRLVAADSPLFEGVDIARLSGSRPKGPSFGLPSARFGGKADPDSLAGESGSDIEVRLPAALLVGREFVVEGRTDRAPRDLPGGRAVRFRVLAGPAEWDGTGPVVTAPGGLGHQRVLAGHDEFRRVFPLFLCFPTVVPTDEVVSLKMFHREDEPLTRLFLDAEQAARIDHLWAEHRFVSRQAVAENDYLPQFIGFVTQDQPRTMLAFFQGLRPAFQKRADDLLRDEEAAAPKQLEGLIAWAERAFRRPLEEKEKVSFRELYKAVRAKGAGHDEAFRGVLVRVLMSPSFLFRIEAAPAGEEAGPVNDWALATRLSYFLWSGPPDDELRDLAAAGKLRDPKALAAQAARMLKDDRARSLAIEFGTQWIHVRGFDELKEKSETLFPTFDDKLRAAMSEESILFFQDLFQADRPVTHLLDADATFLNETLAKHYGVPGVTGPAWRRVTGVRKYGRGGLLGLASVQARQAGASRTSPVLRGNWVVETLLGEKLPRPPADVPKLSEVEGVGGLTMRQQVERHAKDPACAACHVRIDPYGFALEKYDAIGRLRSRDLGGLALDTNVKLRDGTSFEGLDGLREYLLTKKKDVIVRLFCRGLLGYALGRAVTLSDQSLIDEMAAAVSAKDAGVSAAVAVIVQSKPFRMIRGSKHSEQVRP